MKSEEQIHEDYEKFYSGPLILGKEQNWEGYKNGYEMGYQDAIQENNDSWYKELGINLEKYPTGTDDQIAVMKAALQQYYQNKGE